MEKRMENNLLVNELRDARERVFEYVCVSVRLISKEKKDSDKQ